MAVQGPVSSLSRCSDPVRSSEGLAEVLIPKATNSEHNFPSRGCTLLGMNRAIFGCGLKKTTKAARLRFPSSHWKGEAGQPWHREEGVGDLPHPIHLIVSAAGWGRGCPCAGTSREQRGRALVSSPPAPDLGSTWTGPPARTIPSS